MGQGAIRGPQAEWQQGYLAAEARGQAFEGGVRSDRSWWMFRQDGRDLLRGGI